MPASWAAASTPCTADSAGVVVLSVPRLPLPTAEEVRLATAPSRMPTVTRPSSARRTPPSTWRNSTAWAVLALSGVVARPARARRPGRPTGRAGRAASAGSARAACSGVPVSPVASKPPGRVSDRGVPYCVHDTSTPLPRSATARVAEASGARTGPLLSTSPSGTSEPGNVPESGPASGRSRWADVAGAALAAGRTPAARAPTDSRPVASRRDRGERKETLDQWWDR